MQGNLTRPLLRIGRFHRSDSDASRYVGQLAQELGVRNFKTKLVAGRSVVINARGRTLIVDLRKEVYQARVSGVAPNMQPLIDSTDSLMPPLGSLGVSMNNGATISVTVSGHTYTIEGDGLLESPVTALADDVIYYRKSVVESSADHRLGLIARAYRTYLQVCISLVDAFLGHATFAIGEARPALKSKQDFCVVRSPAPFESRIDAWSALFETSPQVLRQTKSWSDLSIIRNHRNKYVHPDQPAYSIKINEMVDVLNRCRDGVGGTLKLLREIAGLSPNLSYIQKVMTAPIIERVKI